MRPSLASVVGSEGFLMAPSSAAEACAEGDWATAIKLYTAELEDAEAPLPSLLWSDTSDLC